MDWTCLSITVNFTVHNNFMENSTGEGLRLPRANCNINFWNVDAKVGHSFGRVKSCWDSSFCCILYFSCFYFKFFLFFSFWNFFFNFIFSHVSIFFNFYFFQFFHCFVFIPFFQFLNFFFSCCKFYLVIYSYKNHKRWMLYDTMFFIYHITFTRFRI